MDTDEPTSVQAKGGLARAAALSPEVRRAIATKAANARWSGDVPKATHTGELQIGDMVLPCSVLEDGVRVLSEGGFTAALGRARSGSAWLPGADPGARMPHFAPPKRLNSFVGEELTKELSHPIKYRPVTGGNVGYGVDAKLIPAICEAWLKARDAGALNRAQIRTAEKAEILIRGLARVGIIALVDEATGYQEVRDRLALQAILDRFLKKAFAAWAKRFPDEFYSEIFRLRGWKWQTVSTRRPGIVAHYTNDLVYARLAPGLLKQLEERNPKVNGSRREARHHQWLTEDIGHPALAQHLYAVIGLMRIADDGDWHGFMRMMDKAFPKLGDSVQLALFPA